MAQIKNGKVIGTVKTEIFGEVNLHVKQGVQQMRSASSDSTNPQSAGQMYQRLKMLTTAPLYQALREAIALGWENIPQSQSLYNQFTGAAMRSTPFGISKELHAKGAGIAWPAQITQGSLPAIAVDDNHLTDILVKGLPVINAQTTVGALAKAIVDGNPGRFRYDDEIAFVEVLQSVDSEGTPKLSCTRAAITLMEDSNVQLGTLVSLKGFNVLQGHLAMSGQPAIGAYCWVHSRLTDEGLKVSSQRLIANNDFVLEQFGAPAALRKAAKSYGADLFSEAFLRPTTDKSRKALRAFAISVDPTKSAQGSVAGRVLGMEYNGVAYFAGEMAPEIDLSADSQVQIRVTDAGEIDPDELELAVNGKSCTNVAIANNTITATMPQALDGDTLRAVFFTDGSVSGTLKMA